MWAVAASAIALIALFEDDSSTRGQGASTLDAMEVETFTDRLDELEQSVDEAVAASREAGAATGSLGERIDGLEADVDDASGSAEETSAEVAALGDRVDDLEQRVEALESSATGE